MRKSLFSLFVSMALLVSFSTPSWAKVVDLDSLQAQLSQNEVVRGDFKQSRHLEMFNQPLTSTGILPQQIARFTLATADPIRRKLGFNSRQVTPDLC